MHVEWESDGSITADGRVIARVDKSFWRERAELDLDGEQWLFRSSWGEFVAEVGGRPGYVASKQGFFSNAWAVEGASDATLQIKKGGLFSTGYDILVHGQVVTRVKGASFWTNRPQADFPSDVPVAEAVFVLWVCYLLMKRDSSSSSSSSSR